MRGASLDLLYAKRYKYLTAYTPVVTFYYRGKAIYRFKATESYDQLIDQVSKMTGMPICMMWDKCKRSVLVHFQVFSPSRWT